MTIPHPTTAHLCSAPDTLLADGEATAALLVAAAEVEEVMLAETDVEDEEAEVELALEVDAAEVEFADADAEAEDEAAAIEAPPAPTDMGVTVPFPVAAFWYHGFPHMSATFPTFHPICCASG